MAPRHRHNIWQTLDPTQRAGAAMAASVVIHLAAFTVLAVGSATGWFRMREPGGGVTGAGGAMTTLVLEEPARAEPEPALPPVQEAPASETPQHAPSSAGSQVQDELAPQALPEAPRTSLIEDAPPTRRIVEDAAPPPPPQPPTPPPSPPRASFAGVEATPARRIVYLIDGSGSMAASLAFVQGELVRSVARLHETQQFQVIVYRERLGSSSDVALSAFATSGGALALTPATRDAKQLIGPWVDDVMPSGRSDPRRAIEAALTLEPDIIFVLTRAIARSGVDVEARNREVLAALERLNPANDEGVRPAKIKAIQFLEDDPTNLLQEIARVHGGGPGSYRLVTRAEIAAARKR